MHMISAERARSNVEYHALKSKQLEDKRINWICKHISSKINRASMHGFISVTQVISEENRVLSAVAREFRNKGFRVTFNREDSSMTFIWG